MGRRSSLLVSTRTILSSCAIILIVTTTVEAFEWQVGGGRPEVTRQAIAGLWRLTPEPQYPLKEFTVYPKKKKLDNPNHRTRKMQGEELLLMLNEDGSFQQYSTKSEEDMEEDEEEIDITKAWNEYQQKLRSKEKKESFSSPEKTKSYGGKNNEEDDVVEDDESSLLTYELIKGVWDFRDGKLILAADRPEDDDDGPLPQRRRQPDKQHAPKLDPMIRKRPIGQGENDLVANASNTLSDEKKRLQARRRLQHLDKLIVGRVVATYETRLQDNPILQQQQQKQASNNTISITEEEIASNMSLTFSSLSNLKKKKENNNLDTHLSVPKGRLKVGKFFYPKNHPSFFEQPIYNPTTINNRAFQLRQVLGILNTAQTPDTPVEPLFEQRHFYNKTFLLSSHPLKQPSLDNHKPKKESKREEKINPYAESAHIRVMQVRFFPNNTFATVWGTGDNILRGKFDVFNDGKKLWMQILRFGFGRSVSGSVYSEGRTLTQDDAKTYWGDIAQVQVSPTPNNHPIRTHNQTNQADENKTSILEVQGSVLFGTGVGAEPVGRFLMREMIQESIHEEQEDEEEEDGEGDKIDISSLSIFLQLDDEKGDNTNTWLEDPNAFQ